jgi:hypothetical protein
MKNILKVPWWFAFFPRMQYAEKNRAYQYLESKVPAYNLPDPLMLKSGHRIATADEWWIHRRPEILGDFQEFVYGITPAKPHKPYFAVVKTDDHALHDTAIRKEVDVALTPDPSGPMVRVLFYLPKKRLQIGPVPLFLGLNFYGNHTIHSDPGITLNQNWVPNNLQFKITQNKAPESTRGIRAHRWQVEYLISQGYGIATAYYGDMSPDRKDGLNSGIHPYFYAPDQTERKPNEWGAIGAWAYGLSRIMDYCERDPDIDFKKVAVMGHSRLGKTALWAGAQDSRFALVISNCSGCGGAAISRRCFGETVYLINRQFPHWFCENFRRFDNNEAALPIDQHELIALIAPRPVYVASADHDLWADPYGEFLGAKNADAVYRLLGTTGFIGPEKPPVEKPISGIIGHHVRKGVHDVTLYDWTQYVAFANHHFKVPEK